MYTSAMLAVSFGWNHDAIAACAASEEREEIAQEALEWRQLSHEGAQAESLLIRFPMRRNITWKVSRTSSRHGMVFRRGNRTVYWSCTASWARSSAPLISPGDPCAGG
jgi:hypothetical protein